MNAISYSLFGYEEKHENCLDFRSYLRGLEMNIRVADILYGDQWLVHVTTDKRTFDSPYGEFLLHHARNNKLDVEVWNGDDTRLCKMMIRRLTPIYSPQPKYDRVICRDTDSLLAWKDRQAVWKWEKNGRIAHVMTDSVSHNIPMMGGMCGFMSKQFRETVAPTWAALIDPASGMQWQRKGCDQDFLGTYVMPKVHHSITEHYFKGMPYSYREDCHSSVSEGLPLPECTKELDGMAFHIGAAGFQVDHLVKWLEKYGENNAYYESVEKMFPEVFYWVL